MIFIDLVYEFVVWVDYEIVILFLDVFYNFIVFGLITIVWLVVGCSYGGNLFI